MTQWRAVPGFEDAYAVSDRGDVFSVRAARCLRPGRMPGGHLSVALGRGNSRCVHELVLLAFVGPRPAKHDGRHLNGVPSDNRLENLSWATRSRNNQDKKWHGKPQKVSVQDARDIKQALAARSATLSALARRYGVAVNAIVNIKKGLAHADV